VLEKLANYENKETDNKELPTVNETEQLVLLMEKKHKEDPSNERQKAYSKGARMIFDWAIEALRQTEIIYCKDCTHKDTSECSAHFEEGFDENWIRKYVTFKDIDFCSYGTRV
jgi:hypothetical protein